MKEAFSTSAFRARFLVMLASSLSPATPHFDITDHLPALRNFALKLTRDALQAEDLVQDVAARSLKYGGTFQQGTDALAWLRTMMVRVFINQYRRTNVRERNFTRSGLNEGNLVDLGLYSQPPPDTHAALMQSDGLSPEVVAAIDALCVNHRLVFLLVMWLGMSYAETARALQIPLGTVMSRVHRARNHLMVTLRDYAREQGLAV